MEKQILMQKIKDTYEKGNCIDCLSLLDNYLNIEKFKISSVLLDIYINCQINLGFFDSANKNIHLMRKKFFGYYTLSDQAIKYMICGNMNKFDNIISSGKLMPIDYYYIAKSCFLWGHYDEAKKLFNHFLSISTSPFKNKSASEYLRKINLYQNNENIFRETDYINFKLNGNSLEPGHIIYAKKLIDAYSENNTDPKKIKRPYMICEIIGNVIYAFPITSNVSGFPLILYSKKYPNYTYDRRVKDNLICINEKDVEKVMDRVTNEDFLNIYYSLCTIKRIQNNENKQSIKDETQKEYIKI